MQPQPSAQEHIGTLQDTSAHEVPLCVDVDGTLLKTDLLWEAIFSFVRAHPLQALLLPFQVLRGRAGFKEWLVERAPLDVDAVPLRESIVLWAQESARSGRPIVLATASPLAYAERLARRLGFVDRVFATSAGHNLKGPAKAEALVKAYGAGRFDYVGDSRADIPVWRESRVAYVLDASGALPRKVANELAGGATRAPRVERPPAGTATAPLAALSWSRELRLHQWLKNVLLAVPLFAAHRWTDPQAVVATGLAFLAFGCVASSAYLFNDLLDLEADRHHPAKRARPFAAGELSLAHGLAAGGALFLAGFAIALALLPAAFTFVLALYFVATCLYSLVLKKWAIVDVGVLAGLYVVRIIAGAAATGIPISFWLLAFSLFLFFSLALGKRYAEFAEAPDEEAGAKRRRGYVPTDLPLLQALGVASGFLAVLVMAFYINSPESQALYRRPQVLWVLIPVLLLWVSRLWLLAHRRALHDDPVVYALTDRGSLLLGAASVLAVVIAV